MIRPIPESEIPPVAGLIFPGAGISWVGESTWGDGTVCLGSDDGRIRFARTAGSGATEIVQVSEAGEAINAAAFSRVDRSALAVSTRNEVVFLKFRSSGPSPGLDTAVYPGGAHGVISTDGGHFVAPIGPRGLLVATPKPGADVRVRTIQADGTPIYFYGAIALGSDPAGQDVIALALRKGGLGFVTLDAEGRSGAIRIAPLGGTDVVTLGSLGEASMPLGIVAAGRDGSIHLLQVKAGDERPISVRFDPLVGVIYQVVGFHGHLVVMTSRATYAMHDVVARYIRGESIASRPTLIRKLDLVAADAGVVHGRLLVVTAEGVSDLTAEVIRPGESPPATTLGETGAVGVDLQIRWSITTEPIQLAPESLGVAGGPFSSLPFIAHP